MNLKEFAREELKSAGLFDKGGDYDGMLGNAVMELIEVFSNQGHSGFSAGMTISLFSKLASYKPITALTLNDDEWNEITNDKYQNKRNSSVFKDGKNGRAYYGEAFVKRAIFPDGHISSWSGSIKIEGDKHIKRCYIKNTQNMPTIVIDIPVKYYGEESFDWDFIPIPESKLDELKKYYDLEIIKKEVNNVTQLDAERKR